MLAWKSGDRKGNVKGNKIISVLELVDWKQLLLAAHERKHWGTFTEFPLSHFPSCPKRKKNRVRNLFL